MTRKSRIARKTKETHISLTLDLDGSGVHHIKTPLPFLTHMLEAFSKHGLFDLEINASGDIEVDDHHLVEDLGIVLGQAFQEALGNKKGITRYGFFILPMDETLCEVAIDFCDRPFFVYHTPIKTGKIKNFDIDLVEHFFEAFSGSARVNLHMNVRYGRNKHHLCEALFKCFSKACGQATRKEPRLKGALPSTKGKL